MDAVACSGTMEKTEVLTDEEVEKLLCQAEIRLHDEAASIKRHEQLPRFPKLDISALPAPYITANDTVARADPRRLLDDGQRQLANSYRKIEDPLMAQQKRLADKKATAGSEWYNMPKTVLTPELKRELQLLRMRSVLDPHRHYKKESAKAKVPAFSQVGTLVEGPSEFFSARMSNSDRKRTLVEETLAGERSSGRFKSKYNEIQKTKTSGKKGHYKALMTKKYGSKTKG